MRKLLRIYQVKRQLEMTRRKQEAWMALHEASLISRGFLEYANGRLVVSRTAPRLDPETGEDLRHKYGGAP